MFALMNLSEILLISSRRQNKEGHLTANAHFSPAIKTSSRFEETLEGKNAGKGILISASAAAPSHNGGSLLSPEALRGPPSHETFAGTLHVSSSSSHVSQGD